MKARAGIALTICFATLGSALVAEAQIDIINQIFGGDAASESAAADDVGGEVDLLWEAETLVPPLYRGRALPTAGSIVTAFAIPRVSVGGRALSDGELVYTWLMGGDVLPALSGTGKSTAQIRLPVFSSAAAIAVEVATPEGMVLARRTARIETTDVRLQLYEDHPLFGTLFHAAFPATALRPETEMSMVAIPYFAPVEQGGLQYAWRINQSSVSADEERPERIHIDASGSSGIARIQLTVSLADDYFVEASRNWNITFNDTESGGAFDPFRSPTTP